MNLAQIVATQRSLKESPNKLVFSCGGSDGCGNQKLLSQFQNT